MKVIFFGTPDYVIPIIQTLLDTNYCKLLAVVTQPDKPTGRKQTLTPSPVKLFAQKHKIPVLTPEKLDQDFLNILISQYPNIDLGILAAYGKILPPELLSIPKYGFLNPHPSLLPVYRGASPVQFAILNGERETGVTIIKLDDKMDHGPIIAQFTEPIKPDDTAESLYFRLFKEGAKVLVTILPAWVEGRIEPREQDHSKATFTKILKKEDGKIDWKWGPEKIERFIRAMTPRPGAFTNVKLKMRNEKLTKRLKILKAHLEKGKLVLDKVQLEGKKPVTWKQFQEGYPNFTFEP